MTTATDTPRLLTVKEAARSLGISREAAYRLVRSGIHGQVDYDPARGEWFVPPDPTAVGA